MTLTSKNIICDISDKTFNPDFIQENIEDYHVRKAARGILIHKGKIALLNVSKRGYHKFPGGGIEENETNEQAFKREALEEAGCECEIIDEGGITIEYRDQFKLVQLSYVFMASVVGEPGPQHLEQGEIDDGHDLKWLTVQEAEEAMSKGNANDYEHKFIQFRDMEIFKFYKDKILQEI